MAIYFDNAVPPSPVFSLDLNISTPGNIVASYVIPDHRLQDYYVLVAGWLNVLSIDPGASIEYYVRVGAGLVITLSNPAGVTTAGVAYIPAIFVPIQRLELPLVVLHVAIAGGSAHIQVSGSVIPLNTSITGSLVLQ